MPADHKSQHKLAAILFADIQGYTTLMQQGEGKAMSILSRFEEVTKSKAAAYNGEVIKTYGDGSLLLFDSTVDAVSCAHEMQLAFQKVPIVPLRVGIHVGEIVRKGNDVFGNGINIASRVESMGVPGAVLISKDAHKRIKNQEAFQSKSLGHYNFKNVEESIEVFALSNEGLVIPKIEELKGKLKLATPASKSRKWLTPALLGILVLAALIAWQSSATGIFSGLSANTSPLSEDIRDKRVAVMLFENQTMNPDLEVFGKMISDWVTKGLMETGEANVISAANIQTQIAQAGIVGGGKEFYNATGVGVVIQGRYYLQENQLMIHANVVDAEKGEVIHALDPIQGPKDKLMDLLAEFTEEILGYWSVRKQTRHLQNPPKFQAYQNLVEATKIFGEREHYEKIEELLIDAYHLDTTFYAPLLKLLPHYGNRGGDIAKRDSLIQYIESINPDFTTWERIRYESILAGSASEFNWLKQARLNEQLFELDPSDQTASYNAANGYIRANYPQKAVDILESIDDRFKDLESEYWWTETRRVEGPFMLGDYAKVIELAKSFPYETKMIDIASLHLRSLVRLDSIDVLRTTLNRYLEDGVYNGGGVLRRDDQLIRSICNESYLLNKRELLTEYTRRAKEYIEQNSDEDRKHSLLCYMAFLEDDYESALGHYEHVEINPENWFGYLRHSVQKGVIYARVGDIESAEALLEQIENYEHPNIRWGFKNYRRSQILTALGRKEEAISALKKSIDNGKTFYPYGEWGNDVFLKPLFDEPGFQELIRPKG